MPKPIPTWRDIYVLRRTEAEELVEDLRAAGYAAITEHSGTCSRDEQGNHWHPSAVRVMLSPDQARRLARKRPAPVGPSPTKG